MAGINIQPDHGRIKGSVDDFLQNDILYKEWMEGARAAPAPAFPSPFMARKQYYPMLVDGGAERTEGRPASSGCGKGV